MAPSYSAQADICHAPPSVYGIWLAYLVGDRLAIKKTGWLRNQELLLLAVLLGARDKVFKLKNVCVVGWVRGGIRPTR